MSGERRSDSELQRQIDALTQRVDVNRADLDALQAQGEQARRQAEASDARAEEATVREQASDARADVGQHRITHLEERADLDQRLIAELQADGLVLAETTGHLQEALRSSRTIGAAIGILMARRGISENDAFSVLVSASQNTNQKLRTIASEVVQTGDVRR